MNDGNGDKPETYELNPPAIKQMTFKVYSKQQIRFH